MHLCDLSIEWLSMLDYGFTEEGKVEIDKNPRFYHHELGTVPDQLCGM